MSNRWIPKWFPHLFKKKGGGGGIIKSVMAQEGPVM